MSTLEEKYLERPKKGTRPEKGRAVRILEDAPVFLASDVSDDNKPLKTVRMECIPKNTIILIWSHDWPGVDNTYQEEECTVLWEGSLWSTIDSFHKEGIDWEYV